MHYVIGDIHGCFDQFKMLLEEEIKLTKQDVITCVGDIITKGKQNLAVVEYLLWLQREGYNISSVLGNHEYRILSLYHSDFSMLEAYLEKYNCLDLLTGDVDQITLLLQSFPFFVETNSWIIAHSYFSADQSGQADVRNMLGSANFSNLSARSIQTKRQIFGHRAIPFDELRSAVARNDRLINVDTCCVYDSYGVLCAINLNTSEVFSV